MSTTRTNGALVWLFAATVLISAFLVFQVQPIISKAILPWFGGSPAVWTTCLLFFQVVLFAGYAYAHVLIRFVPSLWQGVVHVALIVAALVALPITPDAAWKPVDSHWPMWRILQLLAVHVGLPYFLLSATGPLLQAWFSNECRGRSPYRLYALSNVGSLLALLSYPFLIEPAMGTTWQGGVWSLAFGLFAVLCGAVAVRTWRHRAVADATDVSQLTGDAGKSASTATEFLSWLALAAFGSTMLLATTNHVCQDVAVIPFLWVAPLSLYLATFIICFDHDRWYQRRWSGAAAVVAVLVVCVLALWPGDSRLLVEIGAFFTAMFFICMVCHGELVRRKPAVQHLTRFYLACSGGGALGGIFVAVVCPLIFPTFLEMNLALVVGFVLGAGAALADSRVRRFISTPPRQATAAVVGFAALLVVVAAQLRTTNSQAIATTRNFYGVFAVREVQDEKYGIDGRILFHGRIAHGTQLSDNARRNQPTMYFAPPTGIGVTLRQFGQDRPLRVGIVGLGAGTLAAYGREGDTYRFYEINPDCIRLAQQYFTFLKDSPAEVELVLGDARLSMERERPQDYDVLVLDAFSGDAIPAHLLTREAMAVYRRHVRPDGVIAAHISNRHVDLTGVVMRLAEHSGLECVQIRTENDFRRAVSASHWAIMTANRRFLSDEVVQRAIYGDVERYAHVPLWTDQYSNLLQLLK